MMSKNKYEKFTEIKIPVPWGHIAGELHNSVCIYSEVYRLIIFLIIKQILQEIQLHII